VSEKRWFLGTCSPAKGGENMGIPEAIIVIAGEILKEILKDGDWSE
jgi:hypothetical protein